LVNQELASPYIPAEYIQEFERLYVEISRKVIADEIKHKYNNMSKMKLLAEIYDGKKLNINVLSFFLGKFLKEIDGVDLQFINKIFLDKNIDNDNKLFIMSQLKDAGISYEFDFYNKMTNSSIKLNSQSNFEFEHIDFFNKTNKSINDKLSKEPSLIGIANELLVIIYEYYFNQIPPYTVEDLSENLVKYVGQYFNNDKHQQTNFDKWLSNIMGARKINYN
jgi:hypothetical protein